MKNMPHHCGDDGAAKVSSPWQKQTAKTTQ